MGRTIEPDCTVTTVEAREHFAEVVNRAAYGKERIALTRRGKAIAVLVPVDDLELLERIEEEQDIAAARDALDEAEREGTISLEELEARLGL